jgi:multicomponent Na+:H+ antiporter subunit B
VTGVYDSPILRFAARVQAPLLQLYALFVLAHGHYSPGGGFQAGAAFAASYLLPRIAEGVGPGSRGLSTRSATLLAVGGVLVYGLTGLLSLLLGGSAFLDYSGLANLPWPMPHGAAVRAIGTLTVEVGVTMTVMGVMITLYDDLVAGAGGEA